MHILLMVDLANEAIVKEAIQMVDPSLASGEPESREYMDAQSLIAFGLHAAQQLDAVSILVGVLLAKHIKIHIEVGGIPLTAKTLKEGLHLIRNLGKMLGKEEDAPEKPDLPKTPKRK